MHCKILIFLKGYKHFTHNAYDSSNRSRHQLILINETFNYIATIIAILLSLTSLGCRSECKDDESRSYQFDLPYTLYPAQEVYQTDDTIHVRLHVSSKLYDSRRNFYAEFGDQDLYLWFSIARIDTFESYPETQDFLFLSKIGEIQPIAGDGVLTPVIIPKYIDGNFIAEFSFIPQSTGSYSFAIRSDINHYKEFVHFPDKCPGFSIGFAYLLSTSIPDNNFSILEGINTSLYVADVPSYATYFNSTTYLNSGVFVFNVQ